MNSDNSDNLERERETGQWGGALDVITLKSQLSQNQDQMLNQQQHPGALQHNFLKVFNKIIYML